MVLLFKILKSGSRPPWSIYWGMVVLKIQIQRRLAYIFICIIVHDNNRIKRVATTWIKKIYYYKKELLVRNVLISNRWLVRTMNIYYLYTTAFSLKRQSNCGSVGIQNAQYTLGIRSRFLIFDRPNSICRFIH